MRFNWPKLEPRNQQTPSMSRRSLRSRCVQSTTDYAVHWYAFKMISEQRSSQKQEEVCFGRRPRTSRTTPYSAWSRRLTWDALVSPGQYLGRCCSRWLHPVVERAGHVAISRLTHLLGWPYFRTLCDDGMPIIDIKASTKCIGLLSLCSLYVRHSLGKRWTVSVCSVCRAENNF